MIFKYRNLFSTFNLISESTVFKEGDRNCFLNLYKNYQSLGPVSVEKKWSRNRPLLSTSELVGKQKLVWFTINSCVIKDMFQLNTTIYYTKLCSWQHVSTLMSHHQAIQMN